MSATDTLKLFVAPTGELRFVYRDELLVFLDKGPARLARASHVEPVPGWHYGTAWQADLAPVGGPVLGPYSERQIALAAETAWLDEHLGEIDFSKEAP